MKNIILIAPPAAGKGTMSNLLTEKYGMIGISIGQLLRDIDPLTDLGKEIRKCQANRELVDNRIVKDVIRIRLQQDDIRDKGFILDGFPRTIDQTKILYEILQELNYEINCVIYLKVSYDVALQRTLGRLICSSCKTVYNINTGYNNPINNKECRVCGGILEKRNDDNEESLKKGFDMFNNEIIPTIEYYESLGKVIEIDASSDDAVKTFNEIEKKLEIF